MRYRAEWSGRSKLVCIIGTRYTLIACNAEHKPQDCCPWFYSYWQFLKIADKRPRPEAYLQISNLLPCVNVSKVQSESLQMPQRYQTGKICMAWAAMRGATANESRHSLIMHLIVWRGCSDVVIIRIQRHSDSQKPFSIVALSLLNHNTSRQLICCHCQNIYLHPSHPYSLLFLPCSFTANQCTKQHGPLVSCFKLLCVFNKT